MTIEKLLLKAIKTAEKKAVKRSSKEDWPEYLTAQEVIYKMSDLIKVEIQKVLK